MDKIYNSLRFTVLVEGEGKCKVVPVPKYVPRREEVWCA
jgi:hypothetical protein